MKSLFYVIALVLILIWSIGFIGYGIGGGIHIILILALLSVAMRAILEKKFTHKYSN
jgi:O-antigen/teichoic acid export membrane protein